MVYIYKKDLNTNKSSLFLKITDRKAAEVRVRELNSESLFDDEHYYISEDAPKK